MVDHEHQQPIVFKTTDNGSLSVSGPYANSHATNDPPFSHEQSEILASVFAALRKELRADLDVAELLRRVATLEGQVSTLMALLGGDQSRSASDVVRKIRVQR